MVDLIGIEPMTSSMPWKRAPSCATGPQRRRHPLFWRSMSNPSNAPHVATTAASLSPGEREIRTPRSSKIAVLTLLVVSGACVGVDAAHAQAAPAAPPPGAVFPIASLKPALANVQNTIANLSVSHWKAPAETRAAIQQDI